MSFLFSLFSPEAGLFALILAVCFWTGQAFSAFCLSLSDAKRPQISSEGQEISDTPNGLLAVKGCAFAGGFAILYAFACLLAAFGLNDFSVALTAQNAASTAPLIYKLAGSWGNHNGSLLLWLSLLGICNIAAVKTIFPLQPAKLRNFSLLILGLQAGGLGLFCLLTSNPFLRLFPAPLEGNGLNPLLLDPGLSCHPPLLYSGYVCFCVPFALAIAILLTGDMPSQAVFLIRKWTLLGWSLLSGGILLGAWWAYGTLGWGGYWFWDPVENASLMPWLTATALLHTSAFALKKHRLLCWMLCLCLASFLLSLMATFLVRSGIMNSVHSFAANPGKGEFILLLLSIASCGGFGLFALKAGHFKDAGSPPALLSSETLIALNNIFLCAIMLTVLSGTLYPPLAQFFANYILSVGKPFFDQTILPLALMLLCLMGFAFLLPWRGNFSAKELAQKAFMPFLAACGGVSVLFFLKMPPLSLFFTIATLWMMFATCQRLFAVFLFPKNPQKGFWQRLEQKRAFFFALFAHLGVGISLLGLCGLSASEGDVASLAVGEGIEIQNGFWRLNHIENITAPDYQGIRASLSLSSHGKIIATLHPERRFYTRQRQSVSEPAIAYHPFEDVYAVLSSAPAQKGKTEKFLFKLRRHPLGSWFWLGGLIAILSVFLGNADVIFLPLCKMPLSREHEAFLASKKEKINAIL